MKIIHVPFCYWPDAVGGTEVYVDALAREQQRRGMTVVVAAPGTGNMAYDHLGLPVRRFSAATGRVDLRELYGLGDAEAARSFARIVDEEAPDVVHLHAFTHAVSVRLVDEAQKRGLPVVLTYHTPTITCQRGTLLLFGSSVCDGVIQTRRCTRCALHGLGLNKAFSSLASLVPPALGRMAGLARLSGGPWTGLRMSELVELRKESVRALLAKVNYIFATCDWVRTLLLRNGVDQKKITVSRQGLCHNPLLSGPREASRRTRELRVGYFGRLDSTKGIHILVEAIASSPSLPITLDIFGVSQGHAGAAYLKSLQERAKSDARISFLEPLLSRDTAARMGHYDVVAIPSQWLETGPMVVLEAFAAGVPVIGSNLGGIAELVSDGVDGLLVQHDSCAAWVDAFDRLCREPELLERLRKGIRQPRGVSEVADDTSIVYASLLASSSPRLVSQP